MNFDDTKIEADQEFEIMQDITGTLEYPLKLIFLLLFLLLNLHFFRIVKFSNVFHLTIHIPKNYGADTTKVYYIGLRGEFQPVSL